MHGHVKSKEKLTEVPGMWAAVYAPSKQHRLVWRCLQLMHICKWLQDHFQDRGSPSGSSFILVCVEEKKTLHLWDITTY